jgi:hypothetical protein
LAHSSDALWFELHTHQQPIHRGALSCSQGRSSHCAVGVCSMRSHTAHPLIARTTFVCPRSPRLNRRSANAIAKAACGLPVGSTGAVRPSDARPNTALLLVVRRERSGVPAAVGGTGVPGVPVVPRNPRARPLEGDAGRCGMEVCGSCGHLSTRHVFKTARVWCIDCKAYCQPIWLGTRDASAGRTSEPTVHLSSPS